LTLATDLRALFPSSVTEARVLAETDPYAVNTMAEPDKVTLREAKDTTLEEGHLTTVLPPVSWTAITFATGVCSSLRSAKDRRTSGGRRRTGRAPPPRRPPPDRWVAPRPHRLHDHHRRSRRLGVRLGAGRSGPRRGPERGRQPRQT